MLLQKDVQSDFDAMKRSIVGHGMAEITIREEMV